MEFPQKTRIGLLAPLVKGKKGEHREIFQSIIQKGICPCPCVDNAIVDLENHTKTGAI